MDLITLRTLLGWCLVLNFGLLLWWWLWFTLAHDFIYRLHTKMFTMSVETFDAIHYGSMGFFKLLILVLVVTPYLALYCMV